MKFLILISIVSLVTSEDLIPDQISSYLDIIESGLEPDAQGRALLVSLTVTSTSTAGTSTIILTSTSTPQCFATVTAISQCARKRRSADTHPLLRRSLDGDEEGEAEPEPEYSPGEGRSDDAEEPKAGTIYQDFPDAVVTRDGQVVDIKAIMPTKASSLKRDRYSAMGEFDLVLNDEAKSLASGHLEWREVAMMRSSTCGRSDDVGHRARLLNLVTSSITTTATQFSTAIATNAATVTFTVSGVSCTSAGFTFGVPAC